MVRRVDLALIRQAKRGYADCMPVAICNALRLLGHTTPRPKTAAWEKVVDAAGCRHGTTTNEHRVARHLGAKLVRVRNIAEHCPAILTVWNPVGGHALHAVTVIHANRVGATVVNYRGDAGPLIEFLVWSNALPRKKSGFIDRRAFADRLYRFDRSPIYKVVPISGSA